MNFENKVVIVTGGGQGIGAAIAHEFSKNGASVVLAEIDEEAGLEREEIIKRLGGKCKFIASTRAFMSEPDTEPYSVSKGGIIALTHSLAMSLSKYKIRVCAISPGWIEVSDWKKRSLRRPSKLREIDHRQHPVRRVGKPEDIAKACLYLSSEDAGFITGTNLIVDGGMTIKMIYAE